MRALPISGFRVRRFTQTPALPVLPQASTAGADADSQRYRLFAELDLQTFDDVELRRAHALALASPALRASLAAFGVAVGETTPGIAAATSAAHHALAAHPPLLDFERFRADMRRLGEQRDRRILPLAASFLATGLSLGIVTPVLPLLVDQIQLPAQSFGLVVSAFGLARLVGNVPAAALVQRFGKKRVMVWGQALVAVGLGAVGLAVVPALGGASWLVACRLLSGFGVSAFIGGAYLLMADFSTNLNRARTIAPVTAAFQAGTALGPAVGGVAVEHLGITATYAVVGAMFGSIAAANQRFLADGNVPRLALPSPALPSGALTPTVQPPLASVLRSSFSVASLAWRELLQKPAIASICALNFVYWLTFTGATWVIMPLHLVQTLHLGASQMGWSFGFSALTSVLASQPAAWITDKLGPTPTLVLGGGLVAASLYALPLAGDFSALLCVLLPLSVGSTFLSSVPTALVSNLVTGDQRRTQALSLLRTCADAGLLLGALGSGMLCEYTSLATGLQANGGVLLAAVCVLAARLHVALRIK